MVFLMPHLADRPRHLVLGGIFHETNTFSPMPTAMPDFRRRTLLAGEALLTAARGSDSALGGAIAAAEGARLLPALFASATPAGSITSATFARLRDDLLMRIRQHRLRHPRLDGVLLVLHGAMVTGDDRDADGSLIAAVREQVGPRCPIAVVLDFHANISPRMIAEADILHPYRTYPHTDTWETGKRAMRNLIAMAEDRLSPVTAWRRVPLLSPLVAQRTTGDGPMAEVATLAAEISARPGVVAASVVPGFPYADTPDTGATVLVTTDGDSAMAESCVEELAAFWWERRDRFGRSGTPLADLERALATVTPQPERPVVLADCGDNPGAGAPGDATALLQWLIDRELRDVAVATIADGDAFAAAHAAGIGATVEIGVGGKLTPDSGSPVIARWEVAHLGDGVFRNQGPMGHGGATRLGRTATLRTGGVAVIVCEQRVQVLEPTVFRAAGIEPEGMRWLVVKSSVHYRAAFESIAAHIIDVETPGLSSSNLAALTYEHVMRPIVPLDECPNPSALPAPSSGEAVTPPPRPSRMAACPTFTEVTPRAW